MPAGIELAPFLTGHFLCAAIVLAYWQWLRRNQIAITSAMVITWAIVFRLIGIWGEPILEDDYFRFILDGCNFVLSGTPYGIVPSSLFADSSMPPECQEALTWMNNPDLPTIYAPALQYLFALAYLAAPGSIDVLQAAIASFDLAIIVLLVRLAPAKNVLLYAWCPLILKEFAFTAHPDVIGVLALLAAFYAHRNSSQAAASVLLGIACCVKVFAVLALPFILLRYAPKYWLMTLATIGLLYLPFVIQGATDLAILGHFAYHWNFNGFFFNGVAAWTGDAVARYVCGALFAGWFVFYLRHFSMNASATDWPRMDWVFGLLLFVSPVINPWYLAWILPFAVIRPSCWAWTAATVSVLSYITGLNLFDDNLLPYEVAKSAWLIEYGCIALALAFDCRSYRKQQKVGESV